MMKKVRRHQYVQRQEERVKKMREGMGVGEIRRGRAIR